jgi:pimeloyl-ACP methyl ester carboxylesterase
VKLFMKTVGVPGLVLAIMSVTPVWKKLKASAHTLPYDFAAMGDSQRGEPLPDEVKSVLASIKANTLVLVGGKSPPSMQSAVTAATSSIPGATLRVLPGQTHAAPPKSIAPALQQHFSGGQSMSSRYV